MKMTETERMEAGLLYDPGAEEILSVQSPLGEKLKEFNDLFKALADKMRPMVYELGFLK